MNERFIKVFSGHENLYCEGAPVMICASALLQDTTTGKMIVQLKIENISGKDISYAKAVITQLDAGKNPLGDPVSFEYMGISVSDKQEFGTKKPIFLSDDQTRSFYVGISNIGFADGTVWTTENIDWQSMDENSQTAHQLAADQAYDQAMSLSGDRIEQLQKAIRLLQSAQDIRDVSEEIAICEKRIEELQNPKSKAIKKEIKKEAPKDPRKEVKKEPRKEVKKERRKEPKNKEFKQPKEKEKKKNNTAVIIIAGLIAAAAIIFTVVYAAIYILPLL